MEQFYGRVPPIQYDLLARDLHGQRTYYYDAINYNQGKETSDEYKARIAKMEALHDHIASRPGFHVREGHVRRSPQKKKQEQKAVDVQLAVEALEHAARGNMQLATIFTGDLDFEPLFSSLARLGVRTRLIYVPGHVPTELRQAADDIMKVTLEQFYNWAAPSFQATHEQLKLQYRTPPPSDFVNYPLLKEGIWNGRKVSLFQNIDPADNSLLYVEQGDELSEPSYLLIYPSVDKLVQGFALTFGEIKWNYP